MQRLQQDPIALQSLQQSCRADIPALQSPQQRPGALQSTDTKSAEPAAEALPSADYICALQSLQQDLCANGHGHGVATPWPRCGHGGEMREQGLQGLEMRSAERVQALCRHSLDDSAVTGDTQIYFLEATRPPAPVA